MVSLDDCLLKESTEEVRELSEEEKEIYSNK